MRSRTRVGRNERTFRSRSSPRIPAAHDDRAFEAREIATQTEFDEDAVSTALSRLTERELVEHEAAYWAVTDGTSRLEGNRGYERATTLVLIDAALHDRTGGSDPSRTAARPRRRDRGREARR